MEELLAPKKARSRRCRHIAYNGEWSGAATLSAGSGSIPARDLVFNKNLAVFKLFCDAVIVIFFVVFFAKYASEVLVSEKHTAKSIPTYSNHLHICLVISTGKCNFLYS